MTTSCRWTATDQPRTIAGRHETDCVDDVAQRAFAHIVVEDRGHSTPCWISTYAIADTGYTRIKIHRTPHYMHRVVYELTEGPISEGLHLDHLCRVRECCNPQHLEPVTPQVNLLRGVGFVATHAAQTHCVNGHEFTAENTVIRTRAQGGRDCRTCNTERRRRAKRSAA